MMMEFKQSPQRLCDIPRDNTWQLNNTGSVFEVQ
jgi:hypothetical protein